MTIPYKPQAAGSVDEYVAALLAAPAFVRQITHHAVLPEVPAAYGEPVRPFSAAVAGVPAHMGIERLYSHQAEAVDHLRAGGACGGGRTHGRGQVADLQPAGY